MLGTTARKALSERVCPALVVIVQSRRYITPRTPPEMSCVTTVPEDEALPLISALGAISKPLYTVHVVTLVEIVSPMASFEIKSKVTETVSPGSFAGITIRLISVHSAEGWNDDSLLLLDLLSREFYDGLLCSGSPTYNSLLPRSCRDTKAKHRLLRELTV